MKQIRIYATVLGLLACAAAANAQQQLALVDANGKPVPGAQVFAIAGGNKLVQLPPTDDKGTVDLSPLSGLENVIDKPIEVIFYRCDEDPKTRVAYVMSGETAPENKEHCRRWRGVVVVLTGSG